MTRRGHTGEVGFGSDSFLDIIANIVGILIILIVIAGLRVSHAPVTPQPVAAAMSAVSNKRPLPAHSTANQSQKETVTAAGSPAPAVPEPAAVPAPADIPTELLRQEADLQAEFARIEPEQARRQDERENTTRLEQELLARRQQLSVQADGQTAQFQALEHEHRDRRRLLDQARQRLDLLDKELAKAERGDNARKIDHRITPVSQTVTGKELHFRLAQNRVAYVPIDELVERLRPQFERQKHWLLKYRSHEGQVGPVDGFRLNYRMERQRLSALEELRQGHGMVRISLSEWHVVPDSNVRSEGIAEVFRPGSKFLLAIAAAHPDATLTFWVYPDSFRLFRALEQFAHDEGFQVAARPLPFGLPIAGSPHGSRSAGQ